MGGERVIEIPKAIQVPVYTLDKWGNEPGASPDNPNGTVFNFIGKGEEIVKSDKHTLLQFPALRTHSKNHKVTWFIGNEPWNNMSWINLAKDFKFLCATENHLTEEQRSNPLLNFYLMMGFAFKERSADHTLPTSLQSMLNGHGHKSEYPQNIIPTNYINAETTEGLARITYLLNVAGNISLNLYSEELEKFGKPLTVYDTIKQPSDLTKEQTIKHNFFGFGSLMEALNETIALRKTVKKDWQNHTRTINEYKVDTGAVSVLVKQCPVPGANLLIPSPFLRNRWQIPNDIKVMVEPFAVRGIPNIVLNGVGAMDWKVVGDAFFNRTG